MPERLTVYARRLFDGSGAAAAKEHVRVTAEKGRITAVEPGAAESGADVKAEILCPGFIDMQINGAAGVLFNADLSAGGLARIAEGARRGGTAHFLPAFITAPGRAYQRALAAVKEAVKAGVPGVLGAHLEGPFLSPEKPGVHPAEHIRAPDEEDFKALTAYDCGVLLITLAPECAGPGAVRRLCASGAVVFAGHTAAGAEDMAAAEADGLSGVTHLFNAMPPVSARAPGCAGAALASDALYAGIIADGHHVRPAGLELARRALPGRLCLVTDAMPAPEGAEGAFDLCGRTVRLREGRLEDDFGRLAGASLAMDGAVRNMAAMTGASFGEAAAMASAHPARALGLGGELGLIKPGFRASMTLLDADMKAAGTVIDGQVFGARGRPCAIP